MGLPKSKLTKSQKKQFTKICYVDGKDRRIDVDIRFDDECNNNHNTFAITVDVWPDKTNRTNDVYMCGCCHDVVKEHFPEFKQYIKWHGCTSNGPLYYVENTIYHASKVKKYDYFVWFKDIRFGIKDCFLTHDRKEYIEFKNKYKDLEDIEITVEEKPNSMNKESDLKAARSCAIWPDATLKDLKDKKKLLDRLPKLMKEFKKDMESLGFTY